MAKQELIPCLSAEDLKKDYSADYGNNRKHHWSKLIFIRLPQKRKKNLINYLGVEIKIQNCMSKPLISVMLAGIVSCPLQGPQ